LLLLLLAVVEDALTGRGGMRQRAHLFREIAVRLCKGVGERIRGIVSTTGVVRQLSEQEVGAGLVVMGDA